MRMCVNFSNKRQLQQYIKHKRKLLLNSRFNRGFKITPEPMPEETDAEEINAEETNAEETDVSNSLSENKIILYKQNTPDDISWISIVSNYTCEYMYALSNQGVYKSTDYTTNWTITLFNQNKDIQWISICADTHGQNIIAVAILTMTLERQNILYYSNDYGNTWDMSTHTIYTNDYLTSITYNDKPCFIAVSFNGRIYESMNGGKSWELISVLHTLCSSIVTSFSNQTMFVSSCYGNRGIYVSNDYGKNWIKRCNLICNLLAGSFSCQYLAATCNTRNMEGIHVSTDYGKTWNRTLAIKGEWCCLVSNYTGKYLGAICKSPAFEDIYISFNYGESWIKVDTEITGWNSLILNDTGLFASNLNDIYLCKW